MGEQPKVNIWNGIKGIFVSICILFGIITFMAGKDIIFENKYVKAIQLDSPQEYRHINYKNAFRKYFENGKWEYIKSKNSENLVSFIGVHNNNDGYFTEIELQFQITDFDNKNFYYQIASMEINDVPQDEWSIHMCIQEIFENTKGVNSSGR